MDDRTNTFRGAFYDTRKTLLNGDLLDNDLFNPTPKSDYFLRQITNRVTFGIPSVQPVHAAAMHRKSKMIDHYGPEALAGRPAAFQPVAVNGVTRRVEPLIINILNDRIALMQELTTSLCVRSAEEIQLLKDLYDAGYLKSNGMNEEDDGEEVADG
jgi:hypothetical protein